MMLGLYVAAVIVLLAASIRIAEWIVHPRVSNVITRNSKELAALAERLDEEERRIISELDERSK